MQILEINNPWTFCENLGGINISREDVIRNRISSMKSIKYSNFQDFKPKGNKQGIYTVYFNELGYPIRYVYDLDCCSEQYNDFRFEYDTELRLSKVLSKKKNKSDNLITMTEMEVQFQYSTHNTLVSEVKIEITRDKKGRIMYQTVDSIDFIYADNNFIPKYIVTTYDYHFDTIISNKEYELNMPYDSLFVFVPKNTPAQNFELDSLGRIKKVTQFKKQEGVFAFGAPYTEEIDRIKYISYDDSGHLLHILEADSTGNIIGTIDWVYKSKGLLKYIWNVFAKGVKWFEYTFFDI